MRRCWQWIALVMVVTTRAYAEDLSVGARLRVTRADGKSIAGQLADLNDRNLTLEQRDSGKSKQVVMLREDIQRIQISRAPSRKGRGALIGFLSGAVGGGLLGNAIGVDNCQNGLCFNRGPAEALLGVFLGGLGAGIGAAVAPGEKWETVGLAHIKVSVIPARRGARIGLTARF